MASGSLQSNQSYYRHCYETDTDPWTEMGELDEFTQSFIDKFRPNKSDSTVLDLGCGRGRITNLFAKNGFYTVGLDYLKSAFRTRIRTAENASFVQADAFSLPFPGNSISVIVDYGLLHHVRDQNLKKFRQEIVRVLKYKGYFLTNVFHLADEHANRGKKETVQHKGHFDRFFDEEKVQEIIGQNFTLLEKEVWRREEHVFLHSIFQWEVAHDE